MRSRRPVPTRCWCWAAAPPSPSASIDAAIQLLETGVFQANGVKRIGIAGHPEGNPDITKIHGDEILLKALQDKQAYLKANGIEGFIATQFLFEAGPVAEWARTLRKAGIDLPIHVGVPGPATIKTLVKYAAMCGVGNSARFIRKQAMNITKLLTVNTPDEFVAGLAELHFHKPELGIAARTSTPSAASTSCSTGPAPSCADRSRRSGVRLALAAVRTA